MDSTVASSLDLRENGRHKADMNSSVLIDLNIGKKIYSQKWKLSDFKSLMSMKSGARIESPVFSIKTRKWLAKFAIRLYPNGRREDNEGKLSVCLKSKSHNSDAPLTVSFSIMAPNGTNITQHSSLNIIQHSFLKNRRIIAKDGTLIILTEISVVGDNEIIAGGSGVSFQDTDFPDSVCELSKDIRSMLTSSKYTDCVIVCGDEEFPCHKSILSARSPVFNAMFSHGMQEEILNRVEIKDLDVNVVQDLIYFIYSGKVEDIQSKAASLLVAAEKYDCKLLKQMCVSSLCKTIVVGNVLDMLILAEVYQLSNLRRFALEFSTSHKKEVIKESGWREKLKKYPEIISDLYEYSAKI